MSFNLGHFEQSDGMEAWSQYHQHQFEVEGSNMTTTTCTSTTRVAEPESDPLLCANYNYNSNSNVEMSTIISGDLDSSNVYLGGSGSPIQVPSGLDWDALMSGILLDPSLLELPEDEDMLNKKKVDNNDNNDTAEGDGQMGYNFADAVYENESCNYEPSTISSPFDASTSSNENGDEDNVSLCESSIEFQFQIPPSPLPTRQYEQNNLGLGYHYNTHTPNSHQLSTTTTNTAFNQNPEIFKIEKSSIPQTSESSAPASTSNNNAFKSAPRKRRMTPRAESGCVKITTTTISQLRLQPTNVKQEKMEPVEDTFQYETPQPTLSSSAATHVKVKVKKEKTLKKYEYTDKSDPSVKNAIAAKANRDKKKQENIEMKAKIQDLEEKLELKEKELLAIEKRKNSFGPAATTTTQNQNIDSKIRALIPAIQNEFGHMNILLSNRNLQQVNTTFNDSLLAIYINPVDKKLVFDYAPSSNF